jgi:O-methyltransferase
MSIFSAMKENLKLIKLQKRMAKVFPLYSDQKLWIKKFYDVNRNVEIAHDHSDILQFLLAIFELPESIKGCIVEAGAYKGGGTAKISLAAGYLKRDLFVFDSFKGLPENNEPHEKNIKGQSIKGWFEKGNFGGTLEEVKKNVSEYGDLSVCHFVPGWFEDTMLSFKQEIALAYLDVDLAESTRTCLKYLFPLLSSGGAIFSQDGDFPLVINVFKDEKFWVEEVGCDRIPKIKNIGKKITIIEK